MEFSINDKNKIKRNPKRASYNKDIIYRIIDEALICHISFNQDNQPFIIPTIHVRDNDTIFLHGASSSRLIKHIENGNNMAIAFTLLDGIVLARSAFHHSMNYRSAIVFGKGRTCNENESSKVFELLTEKLIPGRWNDARRPTEKEIKATSITAVDIEDASAKIRSGGPIDEDEDYNLNVWAGVLPVKQIYESPLPDEKLRDGIAIPDYLNNFLK